MPRTLGESRNAVTLQILAALIAFLLIRLAQLRGLSSITARDAFRLIGATLLTRRPLAELLHLPRPPDPPQTTPQFTLVFQ